MILEYVFDYKLLDAVKFIPISITLTRRFFLLALGEPKKAYLVVDVKPSSGLLLRNTINFFETFFSPALLAAKNT